MPLYGKDVWKNFIVKLHCETSLRRKENWNMGEIELGVVQEVADKSRLAVVDASARQEFQKLFHIRNIPPAYASPYSPRRRPYR